MLTQALYRHAILPAFESAYHRRKTLPYWRQLERSQWLSREELASIQFTALKSLLAHAAEHSKYYRQRWTEAGLRISDVQNLHDLTAWPLLQKQQIREHRQEMRADEFHGVLMSKSTGGSTGTPLHFDLDGRSHQKRCAATFRGYNWAGGGPGTKQFYFWGAPLEKRAAWRTWKDQVYNLLQRRTVVNLFTLSEQTTPEICRRLNASRPDVVVAYTGALYQFARFLSEQNLKPFSPQALIVGAEKLHGFQRELIEQVFSAPVFETYGSREFMLIGAECPEHQGLHLTTEQLLVEILDDDGRPTPAGQVGNVVITDLYNYAMPFIRYVTGDQAIAGFETCRCGRGLPLLKEVCGRRVDAIQTPDGRSISGVFFPHLMKNYPGVRQFQVFQSALDQLELRVVLGTGLEDSERQHLLHTVTRTVGPRVNVKLQVVPSIELTRAGKQRVVVSDLAS